MWLKRENNSLGWKAYFSIRFGYTNLQFVFMLISFRRVWLNMITWKEEKRNEETAKTSRNSLSVVEESNEDTVDNKSEHG